MITAGIASLCTLPFTCLPPIGWLIAIITGHVAKGQIKQTGQEGNGRATAGLVMGYIGLGLVVLLICVVGVLTALGMLTIPYIDQPPVTFYGPFIA